MHHRVAPVHPARDRVRGVDPVEYTERRFDLAELDAVPADLYLMVDASEELGEPVVRIERVGPFRD